MMAVARRGLALMFCATLFCGTPLHAQAPAPADADAVETIAVEPVTTPATAPAPVAEETAVLDEITVTATKRAKSAREIPVSVDAFNAGDLNQRGAQGAQDALANSPGTSVNNYFSPNLATIQMRGTTTDTVTTVGGAPTGAFFDDIPLGNPSLVGGNPNIDLFDLETIEVLKGPQGTLFGGSALAGALRSVPNRPQLQEFQGAGFYARTQVSDSEGFGDDYGAMLNVPVGDALALRGLAVQRRYPGAVDNLRDGTMDVDRSGATTWRALLRWEPAEALAINALYHATRGFVQDSGYTDTPDRLERSNESGVSPVDYDYQIAQLKLDYAFDAFSLEGSLSRIAKFDAFDVAIDHLLGGQTELQDLSNPATAPTDTRANELRAVSVERSDSAWWLFDQWDWLIGVFNYRADQRLVSIINQRLRLPMVPVTQVLRIDARALAKETALYFDVTRYVGERWELNLGGRLFEQDFAGQATTTAISGLVDAGTTADQATTRDFNPKVALTWKFARTLALRVAATKGFRFGGINVNLDADPDVPPFYTSDELWNYEIGLRSDWFERQLRLDITAFYIDWSRVQISQRSYTGVNLYIDNIGSAASRGVEALGRAFLPFGFSLTLAGAYIDARTTADFESGNGPIPAGRRLPGTPYVTASGNLGYRAALGRAQLDSNLSWSYQGETFNNLAHQSVIPAYQLFGASLGFSFPELRGRPVVTVNAANLLDEHTYSGAFPPNNAASDQDYFPIRPRTISLRIGASF